MSRINRRNLLTLTTAATAISLTPAAGETLDQPLARHVEQELPGFWAYFTKRHPEFGDNAPACLWGRMDIQAIYDAWADTITAYAREAKK